jgi:signal transduction histidine kinase
VPPFYGDPVSDDLAADWARAVRGTGRLVGQVLVPGGRPGPMPWHSRSGGARRLLVAAVAVYGLGVVTAASGTIDADGRANGGVAFLWCLPMVLALVLTLWRPLDGWRLLSLWLLLTPYLLPGPPSDVPVLEIWEWLLWAPVLLAVGWAVPCRTAVGVGLVSGLLLVVLRYGTTWSASDDLQTSLLAVAAVLLVGMSLGARWDARRALAEEQLRTETALAARGALAERARIAREMHDVVAHELSAIAVRAETAPYRVPTLPPEARTELAEMATTARRARAEQQQLLGVLRAEDQQADRAPQPGLSRIADLVTAAREDGVEVTADLAELDVPTPLGLTVFRIVQQSLANAVQHAPGAPVDLALRQERGRLVVEVTNGPGRQPGRTGAGVGLLGMRERAELQGGTLAAGPTADGGFAVRAELPVAADVTGRTT